MPRIYEKINFYAKNSTNRFDLIKNIINYLNCKTVLELGVYKGDFSKYILDNCSKIKKYFCLDPWHHLNDWDKPSNISELDFNIIYYETLEKLSVYKNKVVYLRGKTTEKIKEIEDESLDLTYIDGDHTLKGITIDLLNVFNKTKSNYYITGDDLSETIFQHSIQFEPTFVFPYVAYFAEATNSELYLLPFKQFLLVKNNNFKIHDLTQDKIYNNTSVKWQLFKKKYNY